MAKLIVLEGPDVGSEFELNSNADRLPLTAGRDVGIELPLKDTAVSRRHFRLEPSPRGWRLIDLGSRNQTFLNGEAVKEALLADGDIVRVGDTEMRFESPGAPLQATGIASTIIKRLSLAKQPAGLLERIEGMERSLGEQGPEQDPEKALREALGRVENIFELYGEMAGTTSPDALFQKLLQEIGPSIGADRAAVLLREKDDWVVRASQSSSGESCDFRGKGREEVDEKVHISRTIIEEVAEEGKAILSANTLSDERFRDKQSVIGEEIVSVVAAPIRASGKTAGVIYADRRGPKPAFTEADLQLLVAATRPAGALLVKLHAEEELRRENRNLFRSIAETKKIIGQSRPIEEILEFIRRSAPTPMTVLIEGETGTGKELVASAIHYSSPRRGRPFIAINCAALPENLVESELFGHERGAFTGAVTRRKGRFELADTGTVFLDEAGELSLACQAKLLRLLEEKEFERVGGAESVKVDVRIIAATNKNLLQLVNEGAFREDLYYRLSVLNVRIPALRDRPEDIPLLSEHFLSASSGLKKLDKLAEKKLLSYHWPGNVRQLKNVLESAVVLGSGPWIKPDDLLLPEAPEKIEGLAQGKGQLAARSPGDKSLGESGGKDNAQGLGPWQPMSLQDLERNHIQRVIEHTGGNKKKAAEILGIERCTLYAKIKSYTS